MALFNHKRMTGQTTQTKDRLQLGAGIFVRDFNPKTDTYESIRKDPTKLLGATTGGGTFTGSKVGHWLQIDGTPENTKGNWILDYWKASLQTTMQEITPENLQMGMAAATITAGTTDFEGYKVITPKDSLDDEDYIDSLSFIGRLSGSSLPIVLTIFNAFNTGDLSMNPQDQKETTIALTLDANYDADDLDKQPYVIYYPTKAE